MATELATAFISLQINTADIRRQLAKSFDGLDNQARIAATKAGAVIGGTLKKAVMGAVAGLGLGGAAGIGGILFSGLDRLKTVETAKMQLQQLGKSAQEVKQIIADVTKVVTGTPVPLNEAMAAVPQALAAGLKPGKELNDYIQAIADSAASSGGQAGFGRMALIFGQMISKGKVMGEELMQASEAGVMLRQALQESLNMDGAQLEKALAKGKIGIADVVEAAKRAWGKDGGLAKSMGQTFDGAIGNLKASVARLGANVLSLMFGDDSGDDPLQGAIDGMAGLTEQFDKAGKWVAEHRTEIRDVFRDIGNAVVTVYNALKEAGVWMRRFGDAAREVGRWFSSAWANVSNAVTKTRDTIKDTINTIRTKVSEVIDTLKQKFDSIFGENGWFARTFNRLKELIGELRDSLGMPEAGATPGAPSPGAAGGGAPFNPGPRAPGAGGAPTAATPGGGLSPGIAPGPLGGVTAGGLLGAGIDLDDLTSSAPGARPGGGGAVPQSVQKVYDYVQSTLGFNPTEIREGTTAAQRAIEYAQQAAGRPYEYGGTGPGVNPFTGEPGNSWDCSGIAGSIWAAALGLPPNKRYFATDSNFAAFGFLPGFKAGALNIGTNGGSGENGHMAATLPNGINVESSGDAGTRYGDGALGAQDFDQMWHFPLPEGFASGGDVAGPGTSISDSIPAWLSNGEHVLTAADVAAMGGQAGVYAFRQALHDGGAPHFNDGGAVDLDQLNAQLRDSQVAADLARADLIDMMNNADASESQRLAAQQNFTRAQRDYTQMQSDYPILAAGGTPPDHSIQNNLDDSTAALALAQAQLAELPDDATYQQRTSAQYSVETAKRNRDQAIKAATGSKSFLDEFSRSQGYTPPTGTVGVAGTSTISQALELGNQFVGGLIDTGASLAQMAITGAAAAGSFGAGAAAGPAAGYGIQVGAAVGKRLSSYGFQMAGIGADALIAQLFPIGGPPRWIGYDAAAFVPNLGGMMNAATTSIEKMGQDAINRHYGRGAYNIPAEPAAPAPAGPAAPAGPQPAPIPGQLLDENDQGFYRPDPFGAIGVPPWLEDPSLLGNGGGGLGGGQGGGGSWARGGPVGIYDSGGVLNPGELAFNASRIPEKILTEKQWEALGNLQAGQGGPTVQIGSINGLSPEDVAAKITAQQKLAMMRYGGRP